MDKTISLQEKRRQYYALNKERIKNKSKDYYEKNRDKVLKRIKENNLKNPYPARKRAKKFAEKNPDKVKEYIKKWLKSNPDKRKLYTRNSRIRAYGIEPETYYKLLEEQGHRCAICKAKNKNRLLCIDHDHKTGKVRGLLCDGCNLSLGHIERKGFIEKATQYIAKYK